MSQARIAATRFGAVRHSVGDEDYCAKVVLEWVFLYGDTYRAGKHEVSVIGSKNEQDFRDAVKEALLTHLQAQFPALDLKSKDLMLFGL